MKKILTSVLLTCALSAIVISGCGGSAASTEGSAGEQAVSSSGAAAGSEGEKTLNVFIFGEYIPDSVIEDFEEEFGVDVAVSTYATNEEMLAKLQGSAPGTYDIVNPSDYMTEYLIQNDMLAEIDKDIITNLSNINEQYLGQFYDPDDKYSVPFCPGGYIIAYDTETYPEGFTSAYDILDPKYKNSVVTVNDPKIVIGLVNRSLGFELNETDPEKLEKTREKLMEFKENIYALKDNGNIEGLTSGEITLDFTYNGSTSGAVMASGGRVQAFYPPEGTSKWLDSLCILSTSEKQELANEFINYILRPEVDAKIRLEIPTTTPNDAGRELQSDEMKNSPLTIDPTWWENSEFAANFDEDVQAIYDEMWAEFAR